MRSDTASGGLYMSTKPAMERPQLVTGPQKWVVIGPVADRAQVMMAPLVLAAAMTNKQTGEGRRGGRQR